MLGGKAAAKPRVPKVRRRMKSRVSRKKLFFELSLVLLTTHAIGNRGAHNFFFSVIDSKMTPGERF